MDHSAYSQGLTQSFPGGSNLIDDLSHYAFADDLNGHNESLDNFTWDGQPFLDNGQDASNLGQGQQGQQASHHSSWHQSPLHQPQNRSPMPTNAQPATNYGVQNFHQQPQAYNSRPPSQTAFDPRTLNHTHSHAPSPVQYGGYQFQQEFQYPMAVYNRHHEFQRQQQPSTATQARQSPPGQNYSAATRDQFVAYRPPSQQHAQGYPYYGEFPVQQHREAQSTVDPNLLSAGSFQNFRPEQPQTQYQFQPVHGKPLSPAPAIAQQPQQQQHQNPQSMVAQVHATAPQQPQDSQGLPLPLPPQPNKGSVGPLITVAPAVANKPAAKQSKKKDPNAPKKPRSRPKKDGPQPQQKTPGVASPSDSGSDSDADPEDMAEDRPSLLNGGPPDDPEKRAIWDTLHAAWSPRNRPASPEKIRNGLSLYGELIKRLRNSWREDNEALKRAELTTGSTDTMRTQVMSWRKIVQTVMETTLKDGHPSHYSKFGGHPLTIIYLREFLVDRITASDFDGPLVHSIIKVLAEFTTVDQDMLEKTKMEKALARFSKKSNPEIKNLVLRVLDNAAAETKRKAEKDPSDRENSPTTANRLTPTSGNPVVIIQNPSQAAGTKRPREEPAAQPPPKKPTPQPIREASKPLALQQALKKKEAAAKLAKSEPIVNGKVGEVKSKVPVQQPPPKPSVSSVFSSLASASKKPGTSNAARAEAAAKQKAAAAAAPKKESPPPTTKPAPAPSQQSFSFSQMYAGFNKPKEVEERVVDDRPDETEEERAKRLRKEARKKLRVTWKADADLVQIRLFSHHPDEEIGQTDSMKRDVDDVGGEGRMLKMHADLDDTDEDEETKALGEDLSPYTALSEIDFDGVGEDERKNNFVRRGGIRAPESPSRAAQELLEQTTLLVVHALPSDVPPTPKEPPAATTGEDCHPPVAFGDPLTNLVRERESRFYAATRPASAPSQQTDLNAILGALTPKPMSELERTFSMFSQVQQPQIPQPQQQAAAPATAGLDFSKLLAAVQQSLQTQPQHATPPQYTAPAPATDLTAWFANFQQQNTAQTQNQQGNVSSYSGGNDNDASFPNSRKHGRDFQDDSYDPYEERKKKTLKAGNGGLTDADKAKFIPNFKTVSCKFWKEGKCKKGDDCTFIHD